jgi:hypothetical protein
MSLPQRTHSDRDEVKRRASDDFLGIFETHGGRRRGKALFCPFHKNENSAAASIYKGKFTCFGCGLSLDVFGFIEKIQGTDFKGALAYLADQYGVPLMIGSTLSETEKREYSKYARRRQSAEAEAKRLIEWRDGLVAVARGYRDACLHGYHRANRHVIHCSVKGQCCSLAMDVSETFERRYQGLDEGIDQILKAKWKDLASCFRRRRQAA